MGNGEFQISGRFVAAIFAKIHPESYDAPPYSGDPFQRFRNDYGVGASFDPASAVALNPQPLPPRWAYASALADAYIRELIALDRAGSLQGGEVAKRATDQALALIADVDDICPRWPKWPWPWPPRSSPTQEEMNPVELFVFGMRLLAASDAVKQEKLGSALAALGQNVTSLSFQTR
jgi:hypothetical protein